MRKIKRLNEEIARWAFEILFRTNDSWKIAFTNPTAGPWKTIKATSKKTGIDGEVYRFLLEEDRPDIIMYNDEMKIVIIFEAKDCLAKLINEKQAEKSAKVVIELAKTLHSKDTNEYWKDRSHYSVILGLLWGSTDNPESETEKNKLFDYYHRLVDKNNLVFSDIVIGVETLYKSDKLKCTSFFKDYSGNYYELGNAITNSLN